MKNISGILFAVFILIFGQEAFAQTFGIKAGLNLSNVVSREDAADFSAEPGFHAGVTAEFPVNRAISFETDLLISTGGYRDRSEIQFVDMHEDVRSYYLQVPFLAKAFFEIPTATFSLFAGPYLGFGIYGTDKGSINAYGDLSSWSNKIVWGKQFKRLDYGFVIGPGVQIKHIQISLSHRFGLANISPVNKMKIRNRVTELSLGYKFLQPD